LDRGTPDDRIVLISNALKRTALASQKAGKGPMSAVVWDYHVILIERPGTGGSLIYDPDSLIGSPVPAAEYLAVTFPGVLYEGRPELKPRFSLVSAPDYLWRFSSDRSHMRRENGGYLQPPPQWPAVYKPETGNTLFSLVDGRDPAVERILDLNEWADYLAGR
jgi:hypothetical protein